MNIQEKATQLANFVKNLNDFVLVRYLDHNYRHMGATISDSILQAAIKYDTVVRPRIKEIRKRYPEAKTTSAFYRLIKKNPKEILSWKGDEKPNRILALTQFFLSESIETEEQLSEWLSADSNRSRLLNVRGVGPKTADYLKILVGKQSIAVDRYHFRFLEEAGISYTSYEEARGILSISAKILNIEETVFDNSIWRYMSNRTNLNSRMYRCKKK